MDVVVDRVEIYVTHHILTPTPAYDCYPSPFARAYQRFSRRAWLLHQLQHDCLLRVQPVLRLMEDNRVWRVDHFVRDFFSAMGRQTVHKAASDFAWPNRCQFTW